MRRSYKMQSTVISLSLVFRTLDIIFMTMAFVYLIEFIFLYAWVTSNVFTPQILNPWYPSQFKTW